MKKCFTLALAVCFLTITSHAQFASQVIFQHYFTKAQVDSILVASGVPAGILTTVYDVKTYKVIYNTVDADSQAITATGLMVVPQHTPCDVPMLSYQHNNLFRKSNAPSQYHYEWFIGLASGSLGLITVLPDGLGLGTGPGSHPFLHLQTEATAVIDMLRAAKESVDTTGASYNKQLFLAGISEGAYASLAAHQYIQTYLDPQMHVTGTGAIAGYYDMSGTMVNMILSNSNYNDPSFLPALFMSYNKVYHYAAHDSDIFVSPYDTLLPVLYNGSKEGYQINPQLPGVANQVLQQKIIDTLQNDPNNFFTQLLRKNDAYNWTPTSPVHMFFCTADEIVPYQHSAVAVDHFIANGSVTADTLNVGATYDHNLCGQFSTLAAIQLIKTLIFQPIEAHTYTTAATSATALDGTASVRDTMGDPPYSWHWSNGDSTATITGLAAGTYVVTTTDQSHCSRTDSVVVTFTNGVNDLSLDNIGVYPNPTRDQIVVDCRNSTEKIASLEILDINGNIIDAPAIKNTTSTHIDLSSNAKGIYILHLHTQSGKDLRRKIVLL
ncbi:MAG: esterase/lipase [Bacteroidetes bacterium]|nr:esterase/lipase [Bacteroidota bacterium]